MRRPRDAYYSPAWSVDALLRAVTIDPASRVLEPCSGTNQISNRLIALGYSNVITNDINPYASARHHDDYLAQSFSAQWTITNPPFSLAFQFLTKAYRESTHGVALLLRLSFIEPTRQRGEWLAAHPPTAVIVLPRISFTGDGRCDNVATAWFVWRHHAETQQITIITKDAHHVQ